MLPLPICREARKVVGAPVYPRHHLEHTLAYQLIQEYYFGFKAHLALHGKVLPGYVERELKDCFQRGSL